MMKKFFLCCVGLFTLNAVVAQTDSGKVYSSLSNQELVQKYAGQGSFNILRTKDTIYCYLQEGINHVLREYETSDTGAFCKHEYYKIFSEIDHLLLMGTISDHIDTKWSHYPGRLHFATQNGKLRGEVLNQLLISEMHSFDGSFDIEVWYKNFTKSGLLFGLVATVLDSLIKEDCLKEIPTFEGVPPIERKYVKDFSGRNNLVLLNADEKITENELICDSLMKLSQMSDNYQKVVNIVSGTNISLNDLQYLFLEIDNDGLVYDAYYSTDDEYFDLDCTLYWDIVFPVFVCNGRLSPYCVRYGDDFNRITLNKRLDSLKNIDNCSRQLCTNGNTYFIHSVADRKYYLYSIKSIVSSFRKGIYLERNIIERFSDCYPMQVYFTDINKDGLPDFVYQTGDKFSFPVADHRGIYYRDCLYIYFNHDNSDTSKRSYLICNYGFAFFSPDFSKDSSLILSKNSKKLSRKSEEVSLYKFIPGGVVEVLGFVNIQYYDLDINEVEINSSTCVFYNSSYIGNDGSHEYIITDSKQVMKEKRKFRKLIHLYMNHPEMIDVTGNAIK